MAMVTAAATVPAIVAVEVDEEDPMDPMLGGLGAPVPGVRVWGTKLDGESELGVG